MSFTFGLVIAAIVYTAVSVLFCKSDTASCTNFKLCFCRLPLEIAVSAAIGKQHYCHAYALQPDMLTSGQLILLSTLAPYTPAGHLFMETKTMIHRILRETLAESVSL